MYLSYASRPFRVLEAGSMKQRNAYKSRVIPKEYLQFLSALSALIAVSLMEKRLCLNPLMAQNCFKY